MKKIIILLTAFMLPLLAGAQAQITTKKMKVGDFTEKVTKIVVSETDFFDLALKDEIAARWRISPYEFCSLEEFEALKGNDQYYFLIPVEGQFKKENAPGIKFLTLVKGGKGAEKGIGDMLEVVSVPVSSVEDPSGREFVFLPALIDILQEHTLASMENDINAYGGLGNNSFKMFKSDDLAIVFSEDDLAETVTETIIEEKFDEKMSIEDEDGTDRYMIDNAAGTLVSYVVAPTDPAAGSYCYKMLINTENNKLYYFRRHRMGRKPFVGFLPEDITQIKVTRK